MSIASTRGTSRAMVGQTELRSRFAARLSSLYGNEVPAYTTLVEVAHAVNARVLTQRGADAERLGTIERVTAERHGAIRVGSPRELAEVSRVFGALGMVPCGFYDLRDAAPAAVPVVSTAFRPVDRAELAANPFRVFTSVLVPEDRRFFDADLADRLTAFLDARQLFPGELLLLADRAIAQGQLPTADAERYLELAVAAFALSSDPIDEAWYRELEQVSGVAADIGGVTSTHLNHLTPRVLDIDDLYASMRSRGIEMIDEIQGPPRWSGPDVLLRQTSFRALSEPRRFRAADGTVSPGALRVRFGEVEARGIALTPAGRDRFDMLVSEVDRRLAADPQLVRAEVATDVWAAGMPATERDLCTDGLGFFTYRVDGSLAAGTASPAQNAALDSGDLAALVDAGVLHPEPIVYEDFLPRSAAGIFASNLSDDSTPDGSLDGSSDGSSDGSPSISPADSQGGAVRDADWLAAAMSCELRVPEEIYAEEAADSLAAASRTLGRPILMRDAKVMH